MEMLFGVLRSHLSAQCRDVYWRAALWALIQQAHSQDPARYFEQWVPYLSAQPFWREAPLARFYDVGEYRAACKIAPFATFFLGFSEYRDRDDLREAYEEYGDGVMPYHIPTQFVALEQVSQLWFSVGGGERLSFEHWGACMWPEYLMSSARDAKLKQLKVLSIGEECELEGWHKSVLARLDASALPEVEVFELYNQTLSRVLDELPTEFVEGLRALHVDDCDGFDEGELARLLARADLSRLEALTLGASLKQADFEALCQADGLKGLRQLSVHAALPPEDEEALARLASAPLIARLEDLEIFGLRDEMQLQPLLRADALRGLKRLRVTGWRQWDQRQEEDPRERLLIEGDASSRALTLRVEQSGIQRWCGLLCDAAVRFRLEALSLEDRVVSLAALDEIMSAPSCAALEHLELWLSHEQATHGALLRRLAQHKTPLKTLGLWCESSLSVEAMEVLLTAPAFAALEALSVSVEQAQLLDFLRPLRGLKRLELYGPIDSAEVARFLVHECQQLSWFAADLVGEARQIIGDSPRLQDALRVAVSGRSCAYPWVESR